MSTNTSGPTQELINAVRDAADGFASIAENRYSIVRSAQGLDSSGLTRSADDQIRAAAALMPLCAGLVAPSALPCLLPKTFAACKS